MGRWTRPPRVSSAAGLTHPGPAPAAVMAPESTRLLTAVQAEAFEDDSAAAPRVAVQAKKPATTRPPRPKAVPNALARPGAIHKSTTATDAATGAAASASTTDTATRPGGATASLAPKAVLAKDYTAIKERQNYATLLPKELLEQGVEAKVNVVGELAEVIILSSPSFTARSQDTVIKQVCIDLKTLGFKRVHITDGGDYTMHFGL